MVKVAITGGPGSGKSTIRSIFEALGAHTIDLDILAREVVKPGTEVLGSIVRHFGKKMIASDGTLDRRRLRNIIVNDSESKKVLEVLTHPAILNLLEKRIAEIVSRFQNAVVVVEVPLLAEAGIADLFDVLVLVDADSPERMKRIMERDGCTAAAADALMGLHLSAEKKALRPHFIVKNTGSIENTRICVSEIFDKITEGSSNPLTC